MIFTFFENLVVKKNDKVKFDILPTTNEKCISVTYGSIKIIDSYRFLSSSWDSLLKTLVDSSHKTLKNVKGGIFGNGEKINFVNEIGEKDKTNKDLKKSYPDKTEELEEAFFNYIGENDPKISKTGFPDNKRKCLTKEKAYPYEYFNCLDDYQKPVHDFEKEDFFSKLKNKCPSDEEIKRTMEII